jgi:hypothetical protein
MATNLFCSKCKSTSSLKAKVCRKCGQDFGGNRKYRVIVKLADGQRVSKVVDSLTQGNPGTEEVSRCFCGICFALLSSVQASKYNMTKKCSVFLDLREDRTVMA